MSGTAVALGLAIVLQAGVLLAAAGEPLSAARQREILRDALNAYDRAVGLAREDPASAIRLYREAKAGFEALCAAGVTSATLQYNLGNTCFRLGELGRAILHYRRAESLAPRDARLLANLRYARGRVEPIINPSGESRLVQQLLFWHYQTSLRQRFRALLVLSAAGWPLLVIWLRWRHPLLMGAGITAIVLAAVAAVSLHWQIRDQSRYPPAVIVEGQPYLRLARGENADLALQQPLGPGVELRILQRLGDWVEVRLANGQTGWLPATTVEAV